MFKVCTSVSVKVVTDQISSKAEVMYRIHMTKNQENLHVRQTISKISASALTTPSLYVRCFYLMIIFY